MQLYCTYLNTLNIISIIINRRTVVIILVKLYQVNRTCVQNMGTCIISIHMHAHTFYQYICMYVSCLCSSRAISLDHSGQLIGCLSVAGVLLRTPLPPMYVTNKEIRNQGRDQIYHTALRAFLDLITPDRTYLITS